MRGFDLRVPLGARHPAARVLLATMAIAFVSGASLSASAALIVVDGSDGVVADDGLCTLVEAIHSANDDDTSGVMPGECDAGSGPDTIELQGDVALTEPPAGGPDDSGTPAIESEIRIDGQGFTVRRADGSPEFRLFTVRSNGALHLERVTVTNGFADFGGAISYSGPLVVSNSTIRGNQSHIAGGGISGSGAPFELVGSSVVDNLSRHEGGGLRLAPSGLATTIRNSTIANNEARSFSSGLSVFRVRGSFLLENSTVSGNRGGSPGVTVFQSASSASIVFRNSTIAGNVGSQLGFDRVHIENTLISGPGKNCGGTPFQSVLSSFSDDDSCLGLDPMSPDDGVDLHHALADNGGPTLTHALPPGSVAIDAAGDCELATDQRGRPRPIDGDGDGVPACDSGAYEFEVPCHPLAGKTTGGGEVVGAAGRASFGFNAKRKREGDPAKGHLDYVNHDTGLHVSGPVDELLFCENVSAVFSGTCAGGSGPCAFEVTVEDHGEPGRGADRFGIEVSDDGSGESQDETIGKGNIQIH